MGYALIAPPLILLAVLIFFPAGQAIVRTVMVDQDAGIASGLTLDRYFNFFNDKIAISNLLFTLRVTLLAVFFQFAVCFPISLYLRFSSSRIAGAVQVLTLFPLFVPGVILAFALIRFLGPRGTVDTILREVFQFTGFITPYQRESGIVFALVWDHIPFTVLVLTAGLRQVEDSVIEAARDVGASSARAFLQVILPLMQRPALIVFCLNVIGVFGAFTIPYLIGPAAPQMMGVYMRQTFDEYLDRPGAETQAVITFVLCALVGVLYVRTVTRRRGERA
ncbi:MAG: ABC transporter permease subunit [Thermoflexales bacterium]|nr:ABC transporter permease subunit [Thermoflexales bacterium]